MNALRLLPLVIIATSALLVLRGISIVSDGAFNAFGTSSSIAQQAPAATPEMDVSRNSEAQGESGVDMPLETQSETAADMPVQTADLQEVPSDGGAADNAIPNIRAFNEAEVRALRQSGMSEAEVQVLLRLRERREQLAGRERQLELREQMLKAMETSLQNKLTVIENSPDFASIGADGKPKAPSERLKGLVQMYEAMKPKDAARILSRLDTALLADLAKAMNPRRMSAIMANMDSESAERLTLALAGAAGAGSVNNLPQIGAAQ
ncbi:MAG: hypothetical protein AAF141_00530 [Pseudomonadota bacterium]